MKDSPIGVLEIDLVCHGGETMAGSFVHTMVMADIASGWTECVALIARDGALVVEGIAKVRTILPFAVRALDSDNGGEIINEHLMRYCDENAITLTRSRPYQKNDQAWVEQKNGAVVRKMIGYGRIAGLEAARCVARLYAALRLYVNFYQPDPTDPPEVEAPSSRLARTARARIRSPARGRPGPARATEPPLMVAQQYREATVSDGLRPSDFVVRQHAWGDRVDAEQTRS